MRNICFVKGCKSFCYGKGMCVKHYTRFIRYGDVTEKRKETDIKKRIEKHSTPVTESGCWIWTKYISKCGYGEIQVNGKRKRAHRVSYEAFVGPIPEGMLVCHKCDVPSCVNPGHLYAGTNQDNDQDRAARGRAAKGESHGMSKLTEKQVRDIFYMQGRHKDIGRKYNVSGTTVGYIKNKKIWKHVTNNLLPISKEAAYTEEDKQRERDLGWLKDKEEVKS